MRFKEGQKVKVRQDLVVGRQYGQHRFNGYMEPFKGRVLVVFAISDHSYRLRDASGLLFSDEMLESVDFTKSDLETGMVVEYREGSRRVVFGDCLLGKYVRCLLKEFEETLLSTGSNHDLDIMKVYRPRVEQLYGIEEIFKIENLELIWERQEEPEAEEMTLAEIEKELGRKIKIVSEES